MLCDFYSRKAFCHRYLIRWQRIEKSVKSRHLTLLRVRTRVNILFDYVQSTTDTGKPLHELNLVGKKSHK